MAPVNRFQKYTEEQPRQNRFQRYAQAATPSIVPDESPSMHLPLRQGAQAMRLDDAPPEMLRRAPGPVLQFGETPEGMEAAPEGMRYREDPLAPGGYATEKMPRQRGSVRPNRLSRQLFDSALADFADSEDRYRMADQGQGQMPGAFDPAVWAGIGKTALSAPLFAGDWLQDSTTDEKVEGAGRMAVEMTGAGQLARMSNAGVLPLPKIDATQPGMDWAAPGENYDPAMDAATFGLGAMFTGVRPYARQGVGGARIPATNAQLAKDSVLDAMGAATGGGSDLAIGASNLARPAVRAGMEGVNALAEPIRRELAQGARAQPPSPATAPVSPVPQGAGPATPGPGQAGQAGTGQGGGSPLDFINSLGRRDRVPERTDWMVRRLIEGTKLPRPDVRRLTVALSDAYERFNASAPEFAARFPFARFIDENVAEVAQQAGIDISEIAARDIQKAFRQRGRTAHGDSGPGDPSRATMATTIGKLRKTQQEWARAQIEADDAFGKLSIPETKTKAKQTLQDIGRDVYEPALGLARRVWKGDAQAAPGEREAMERLQAHMANESYQRYLPDHIKAEAALSGNPFETRIASDPASAAHWVQSGLGEAVEAARKGGDRGLARVLGEARARLIKELETAVPGYKNARLETGDEFLTLSMQDMGPRIFSDTLRPDDIADMAADFSKALPHQKEMAFASVRDELFTVFEMAPEDAAVRLSKLARQGTLNGLEKVFGDRGKKVADTIRQLRDENQWLRGAEGLPGVDALSGSNTVDNILVRAADLDAVRSPAQRTVARLGDRSQLMGAGAADLVGMTALGMPFPMFTTATLGSRLARGFGNPSRKVLADSTEGLFGLPKPPQPASALASPPPAPARIGPPDPKRSAAAVKAAETRKRNKEALEAEIAADPDAALRRLLTAHDNTKNKTLQVRIRAQIRALPGGAEALSKRKKALPPPSRPPAKPPDEAGFASTQMLARVGAPGAVGSLAGNEVDPETGEMRYNPLKGLMGASAAIAGVNAPAALRRLADAGRSAGRASPPPPRLPAAPPRVIQGGRPVASAEWSPSNASPQEIAANRVAARAGDRNAARRELADFVRYLEKTYRNQPEQAERISRHKRALDFIDTVDPARVQRSKELRLQRAEDASMRRGEAGAGDIYAPRPPSEAQGVVRGPWGDAPPSPRQRPPGSRDDFTRSGAEAAALRAQGASDSDIARRLGLDQSMDGPLSPAEAKREIDAAIEAARRSGEISADNVTPLRSGAPTPQASGTAQRDLELAKAWAREKRSMTPERAKLWIDVLTRETDPEEIIKLLGMDVNPAAVMAQNSVGERLRGLVGRSKAAVLEEAQRISGASTPSPDNVTPLRRPPPDQFGRSPRTPPTNQTSATFQRSWQSGSKLADIGDTGWSRASVRGAANVADPEIGFKNYPDLTADIVEVAEQRVRALVGDGIELKTKTSVSNVSPSAYIEVDLRQGDDILDTLKIRVSDHADRYGADATIRVERRVEELMDGGEFDGLSIPLRRLNEMVDEVVSETIKAANRRGYALRRPSAPQGGGGSVKPPPDQMGFLGGGGPPIRDNRAYPPRVVDAVRRARHRLPDEAIAAIERNARLPKDQRKSAMEAAGDTPAMFAVAAPFMSRPSGRGNTPLTAGPENRAPIMTGLDKQVQRAKLRAGRNAPDPELERAAQLSERAEMRRRIAKGVVTRWRNRNAERLTRAGLKAAVPQELQRRLADAEATADMARDLFQKMRVKQADAGVARDAARRMIDDIEDVLLNDRGSGKPRTQREAREMARLLFEAEYADTLAKALRGEIDLKPGGSDIVNLSLMAAGGLGVIGIAGSWGAAYDDISTNAGRRAEEMRQKRNPQPEPERLDVWSWDRITSNRRAVEDIQLRLRGGGYNVAADGRWGPRTENALRHWLWTQDDTIEPDAEITEELFETFRDLTRWPAGRDTGTGRSR